MKLPRYDCPGCLTRDALTYRIVTDTYVCKNCGKHYDVLSTEHDHVAYDGGPPREVSA